MGGETKVQGKWQSFTQPACGRARTNPGPVHASLGDGVCACVRVCMCVLGGVHGCLNLCTVTVQVVFDALSELAPPSQGAL